jgi:hypothetical protein
MLRHSYNRIQGDELKYFGLFEILSGRERINTHKGDGPWPWIQWRDLVRVKSFCVVVLWGIHFVGGGFFTATKIDQAEG